jgi:hypothetical protein
MCSHGAVFRRSWPVEKDNADREIGVVLQERERNRVSAQAALV